MPRLDAFARRIVDDLAETSPDLLQPGLATSRDVALDPRVEAGYSTFVADAFAIARRVPSLLEEVAVADRPDLVEIVSSRRPVHARLSRRPSDYSPATIGIATSVGVLPTRWERIDPRPEPQTQALRWLVHVLDFLRERIDGARSRTEKQVAESRASRKGTSVYAVHDALALGAVVEQIRAALAALDRARHEIFTQAGRELLASERLPSPFPRGETWRALRLSMPSLLDKSGSIAAMVRAIYRRPQNVADVQYLYQRWCCLRVIRALEALGWKVASEIVGPIYLGGRVKVCKAAVTIDVWIEPRLAHARAHDSGFATTLGTEATPDLLFVTPGPFGVDGWVLDPTLAADATRLRDKAHYRDVLVAPTPAVHAGVRARRPILRSWAAAPLRDAKCKLLAPFDGTAGVVPMHPLEWSSAPLEAWLGDLCDHAESWAPRRAGV